MGLPSEEFLLPVERYNLAVGPMFAEFKFPLDENKSGLIRSLGIFLDQCFRNAMTAMDALRPEPLTKEQWLAAPPEEKERHLHWQRNLGYLRDRNKHFVALLYKPNSEENDDAF
jgi:hypothetical protein